MCRSDEDMFTVMRWSSESYVSENEPNDPSDFLYETSGDIFNVDDDENPEIVGKFRLYYIDIERAINTGNTILDVLDIYSHTSEYYALFDSNVPDFSDRVMKLLHNEVLSLNLLILDRLEILPRYRGRGLGLSVMKHMIRRFSSGTGVVAIKPFPLQFEDKHLEEWRTNLELTAFTMDKRLATKKLFNYYSKLGFLRVTRTPFMVRATE